jgi:hypothetical protein
MKTKLRKPVITNYWLIAIVFIIIKLSIHLLTCTNYELLRDEMLFFNMGEHLDFGYATVPPMTGFLAFLMHKTFGFSVFGIRLFPAVMGAMSVYIIALMVKELGAGIEAMVIACSTYIFTTGLLLASSLFTPTAFDELIWLFATWLILRMVRRNNPKMWICIAIVIALGFLNKYSVLFFIVGFVIAFPVDGKASLFYSRYFFLAILIGIIIITPNIIWQYNHGWPVLIHMTELKSSQLDLLGYSGFFLYLFSFSQGSVIIWLTGLVAIIFLKKEKEYRYLGVASLSVMVLFFLMKGKGYYVMGLFPFLFAFAGYVFEKYMKGARSSIKWFLFSISAIISIAAVPSGLQILSFDSYNKYLQASKHFICHPLMEWDNGESHEFPQAYSDMTGWKELARYVAKAYNSLTDEEKGKCTIYCERSYGYAGAVYFYGHEYNLPLPVTFHESYLFWAPDSIPEGPMIYIFRNKADIVKLFSDITEAGTVTDKYFRERGLTVYLCKSPKKDICSIYKEKAKEEKNRFRRIKM